MLRAADLRFACALADVMLEQFEDARDGGFFFTSHDHEALVLRPKSGYDGAVASGNGVAALQLQRLGHLVGEPRYLAAARRTMELFAAEVTVACRRASQRLVTAMAEYHSPPTLVMLTGPSCCDGLPGAPSSPNLTCLRVISLQLPDDTAELPAMLARTGGTRPQAWVCRGTVCLPPIADIESLLNSLS